nr:acyl-CoA dehydrogenase family protein [Microcella alkalica]
MLESWTLLPSDEQQVMLRLRETLMTRIAPVLDGAWEKGELPDAVLASLIPLRLMDPPELKGRTLSALYSGFRNLEIARVDASVATVYNLQAGLFRTVVSRGGSGDQFARWDPMIRSFAMAGAFALTEPDHGSDIARGLRSEVRRDGSDWILNGAKRWIGGADRADRIAVVARERSGEVRCLLVDPRSPGVTLRRIERKTSLRIVQNFDITFENVRVSDDWRLAEVSSFGDIARCLREMRADVGWIATGTALGAYEAALEYALRRSQFGRPLTSFQLVQERLTTMLGHVSASLALMLRLTQRQTSGKVLDEDSALAKSWITARLREVVALARETCGGNGITLESRVARFHADAEGIYSYEGTYDINSLIVGRAITGYSAFGGAPHDVASPLERNR